MKERQRWQSEKASVLHAGVKQYEPREWNHVSQRMKKDLDRDSKSGVESWKNYLKPGIKRGSLPEDEQCLVTSLQGKYGNRWKKIADQLPGTTAKRPSKWPEFHTEKQDKIKDTEERIIADSSKYTIEGCKDRDILETYAEKYMQRQKQLATPSSCNLPSIVAMPSGLPPPISLGMPSNPTPDFIHFSIPTAIPPGLPPWVSNRPNSGHGSGAENFLNSSPSLSKSNPSSSSSPSVTLSLSPSSSTPVMPNTTAVCSSWVKNTPRHSVSGSSEAAKEKTRGNSHMESLSMNPSNAGASDQREVIQEMSTFLEHCRELEERQQSWVRHKKETCWRLKRLEQQLEAEKVRKRQEKLEEIEFKVRALREEESLYLDRLDNDYKEQLSRIQRDAEIKDDRMMEMWTAKHAQLGKFFEQIVHRQDPHKSSGH